MSWDAHLTDDRGHEEGWWNYTHNCNGMINAQLSASELRDGALRWWARRDRPEVIARIEAGEIGGSWWQVLDGMEGPQGAALLGQIIRGLEADPERFRAMNPPNGWGDYDSLLSVLRDMHKSVPEWPCTWSASG